MLPHLYLPEPPTNLVHPTVVCLMELVRSMGVAPRGTLGSNPQSLEVHEVICNTEYSTTVQ